MNLSKKMRTLDDWNALTQEEARRLTPEETLVWLHAYEIQKEREMRQYWRRKNVQRWGKCLIQVALLIPMGGALLWLAGLAFGFVLKAMQAQPFILGRHEMETTQQALLALAITGPIAWKLRKWLD